MRVSRATIAVAVSVLVATTGCSTITNSSVWQKMTLKNRSKAGASTALSTAPPAPQFNTTASAAPTAQPAVQGSGNLPVYPGTTYPVTPYPASAMPAAAPAGPSGYAAYTPPASPVYPDASAPQAGPYGQQPNPYAAAAGTPTGSEWNTAAAGQSANPYAASPYAPPQNAPYNPAAPAAGPYNAAGQQGTVTR